MVERHRSKRWRWTLQDITDEVQPQPMPDPPADGPIVRQSHSSQCSPEPVRGDPHTCYPRKLPKK